MMQTSIYLSIRTWIWCDCRAVHMGQHSAGTGAYRWRIQVVNRMTRRVQEQVIGLG